MRSGYVEETVRGVRGREHAGMQRKTMRLDCCFRLVFCLTCDVCTGTDRRKSRDRCSQVLQRTHTAIYG